MKVKQLAFILFLLTSVSVMANETIVRGFELKSDKASENRLSIKVLGNLNDNPQMTVGKNTIEILIPNSRVATKIVRHFNESVITATQEDRESVKVKLVLPYSLSGKESLANITLKDGSIDINFPRLESGKVTTKNSRTPSVKEVQPKVTEALNAEAEKLDESYLSTLVKENEKLAKANHPEMADAANKKQAQVDTKLDADRVNLTQSSVQKETSKVEFNKSEPTKSNFSITSYIGKFVAFMSLMVFGFYGVLTLFKKGVIKKGKLGFLQNTKMVEVISTTHVAPKRSLMMVKAHKQVFLISNTEGGIQLISEIQDVSGLIKTGEEEITGSNFDTNLYKAARTEKEFKLKEDTIADNYTLDDMLSEDFTSSSELEEGTTSAAKSIAKAPVKDQVKFSDQIKTKLKNMKQIQY